MSSPEPPAPFTAPPGSPNTNRRRRWFDFGAYFACVRHRPFTWTGRSSFKEVRAPLGLPISFLPSLLVVEWNLGGDVARLVIAVLYWLLFVMAVAEIPAALSGFVRRLHDQDLPAAAALPFAAIFGAAFALPVLEALALVWAPAEAAQEALPPLISLPGAAAMAALAAAALAAWRIARRPGTPGPNRYGPEPQDDLAAIFA